MTRNTSLHGVYAITDEQQLSANNLTAVEQALAGGVRILQYRDKSQQTQKRLARAGELKQLCHRFNALLIINDDIELCRAVAADGVHLGRDDAAIDQARAVLGDNAVIGTSCYNRLDLAVKAARAGADYLAFGAVFPSPTKPDAVDAELSLLRQAKAQFDLPVCAIGGITPDNAGEVIHAGADMIAVISSLFQADDIQAAASTMTNLFNTYT